MATRLTGEAARRWLAENPNATYINNRTGQTVARKQSGIERFALGLSKPFRTGVGIAQEFGGTIGDLSKMARGDFKNVGKRPKKYALMSEEETQALQNDPLKVGLKSGVGVASFGLGGGAGKGATVGARMLSGGVKSLPAGVLGGLGYSEDGEELGSMLKGGALSFGLGAAAQGFRELGTAAKAAKATQANTVLTDKIDKQYAGLNKLQKKGIADQARIDGMWKDGKTSEFNIKRYLKARDITGMKTGDSQKWIDKLGSKADEYGAAKDEALKGIKINPNASDEITASLYGKLGKEAESQALINSTEFTNLSDDINRAAQSGDATVLDDLRATIRNKVGYKNDGGVTAPITSEAKIIYDNAADAITDYLKALSPDKYGKNIESLSETLGLMGAKELTVAEKASNKGLSMYGLQTQANILPINKALGGVSRGVGRVEEGIGGLSGGLGKLGGELGQRMPGKLPVGGIANVIGQMGQQEQPMEQPMDQGLSQGLGQPQQSSYGVYEALAEASQMMPGASESEIMSLAKMLMAQNSPEGGAVSSKDYNNAMSGLRDLGDLEGMMNSTPLGAQILGQGNLSGFVGGKDYQIYQGAAKNIADLIARVRTGAQINEEEMKLYMKEFLPAWFEGPEAKQAKVDRIRQYLEGILTGQISPSDIPAPKGATTPAQTGAGISSQYNAWQE